MSGAGKGLTGRAGMLWVALSCELRTAPDKRKPIIRSGIRPGISECIISLGQSHLILRFGQAKTGRVEALHDLRKESGTEVGKDGEAWSPRQRLFRAEGLYNIDACGACGREPGRDDCGREQHERRE